MLKNKEFIKNIIIFALSSLGSKSITLILLPMYSQNLTISEYGQIDLIQTLVMLLMPLVSMSLGESILKFCINKDNSVNNNVIISTALFTLFGVLSLTFVLIYVLNIFIFKDNTIILIFLFLFSISLYEYLSKYSKGIDKTLSFAWSGILLSIFLLIFNLYYIYFLNSGISGFLKAQIFSYFIASIYLIYSVKLIKNIRINYFNKNILKKMFIIGAPLIPNAAMWWVFNASDRWVLYYFHGTSIAGSYAVATKLASILFIVNAIIFQAWQIEALKVRGRPDKNIVYKKIIETYFIFICFCASLLIVVNSYFIEHFLSSEFASSWKSGNILIVSSVFFCSASFLGVFYIVFEKTKSALTTSLIAAISNSFFNLFLIPKFGIAGASFATLFSTLIIFIIRCSDAMKLSGLRLNKKRLFIISSMLLFQVVISNNEVYYSFLLSPAIFFISLFFLREYLINILRVYVR